MKHFTLIAAALLGLAGAAHGQNNTAPSKQPEAGHAGTSQTESVLKQNLPPINLQPGQPSDPSLRVAEPAHFIDLQARIAKLKATTAECPRDYHLAKAQAWLNFGRDQFHERVWQKDIQASTLNEARRIVDALEAGQNPGLDTPLVSGAQKIRPDLWAIAQKIKADVPGPLCCAQRETAFCEVQLVWSGHALANLGGWRRANPHVRMAEDLCREARQTSCPPAPPPPTPPQPPETPRPPPTPTPPQTLKISLAANTLFPHDKSDGALMLEAGRVQLNQLIAKLGDLKGVERILITGHSDKTNSSGDPRYNDRLSLARANSVRSYLTVKGADMSRADVASIGDRAPVKTDCPAPKGSDGIARGKASRAAMQTYYDCLQPNRRVEIEVTGVLEKR